MTFPGTLDDTIMPSYSTFLVGTTTVLFNWSFGNPKRTYENGVQHLSGEVILQGQVELDALFGLQRAVTIRVAGDLLAGGTAYIDHWGANPAGALGMHYLSLTAPGTWGPTVVSYDAILTSFTRDSSAPLGIHRGNADFVLLTASATVGGALGGGDPSAGGPSTGGDTTPGGGDLIQTGTVSISTPGGGSMTEGMDVGGDYTADPSPAGAYLNVLLTNNTQGTANQTRGFLNDDGTWVALIPWVDGTADGDGLTLNAALYDAAYNMLDMAEVSGPASVP